MEGQSSWDGCIRGSSEDKGQLQGRARHAPLPENRRLQGMGLWGAFREARGILGRGAWGQGGTANQGETSPASGEARKDNGTKMKWSEHLGQSLDVETEGDRNSRW